MPGPAGRITDASPRAKAGAKAGAKGAARPGEKRAAAVDLGVLNERLGYFVRRLQVWVFQDFLRRLSRLGRRPEAEGRRHALVLTRAGEKLLAEATRRAEQHEDVLKQKLGAKQHRTLLE